MRFKFPAFIDELLEKPKTIMRVFGLGALVFFVGVGVLQSANRLINASIFQELTALIGLIILVIGFAIAMSAQVLLILHRFKHMGELPEDKNKSKKK